MAQPSTPTATAPATPTAGTAGATVAPGSGSGAPVAAPKPTGSVAAPIKTAIATPKPGVVTAKPNASSPGGIQKSAIQPVAAPSFKIESVVTRQRYLKILVYGDFGVGKTFLMGTSANVPAMTDVLMISAESGDMTLDADVHNFPNIDVIRVTNYKQLGKVHEYLKLHCMLRDRGDPADIDRLRELESKLKGVPIDSIDTPRMYRTVIIDSLTEAETYCMNQLLGITDLTKIDEEVAVAEWAEYRRQHSMVQRLVREFRDLQMHVLITAARQYVQDEKKTFNYSPAMTGKLANQIQGFMDVVGYLVIGQNAEEGGAIPRRLWVQPVGRFSAKCRFTSYKGAYFDNPTIGSILKAVGLSQERQPGKTAS